MVRDPRWAISSRGNRRSARRSWRAADRRGWQRCDGMRRFAYSPGTSSLIAATPRDVGESISDERASLRTPRPSPTGSDSRAVVGLLLRSVPRWFLDRKQDRAEQMSSAVRRGLIAHPGQHGAADLADQFGEFVLVEPERELPVGHRVG